MKSVRDPKRIGEPGFIADMPGARVKSGSQVTLRTVESEDIPFLQRASANPEIRYPIGNPVRNQGEIEVSDQSGTDQFLVCLEDTAGPGQPGDDTLHPIGQVTVRDADWKRPELGFWIKPAVQDEGHGKESVSLGVDYVFREYETPAVGAAAFDCNDASRHLLESLGFTEEGRQRKLMFVDGAYRDMVLYGLLRSEWGEGGVSERSIE